MQDTQNDNEKNDGIDSLIPRPMLNGNDILRMNLDLSIDYKNYERNIKVWGEEVILCRSRFNIVKLLIVKPYTMSSYHRHKLKYELLLCLKGYGTIIVNEQDIVVNPGDQVKVDSNIYHGFKTLSGMVLLDVSNYDSEDDVVRLSRSVELEKK